MPLTRKKPKLGKLKRNNVRLEPHEERTVKFLREQGHDIELIPPSSIPKSKTADMIMDGGVWEMKSIKIFAKAFSSNAEREETYYHRQWERVEN